MIKRKVHDFEVENDPTQPRETYIFDTKRPIYMIKRNLHDLEVENNPTQPNETFITKRDPYI